MSEQGKHTPGPLIASQGVNDELDRWGVFVDGPKQWHIATIENGQPGDTMKTEEMTARLFAAAPDLLAALKAVEWANKRRLFGMGPYYACCPSCDGLHPSVVVAVEERNHRSDCALSAAIQKAVEVKA